MLPVPVSFIEKSVYAYQQTCKRAQNVLDLLVSTHYVISEKKLFRTVHYEVNIFGEIQHKFGSTENAFEHMLNMDRVSCMDYQLLKFYDLSDAIDMVIEVIRDRGAVDDVTPISIDELQLLHDIASFSEDNTLTKEDILSGEQL